MTYNHAPLATVLLQSLRSSESKVNRDMTFYMTSIQSTDFSSFDSTILIQTKRAVGQTTRALNFLFQCTLIFKRLF